MDDVIELIFKTFSASTLPVAVSASRWCYSYTNEEEQQPQHTASVCLCVLPYAFTVDVTHLKREPRARDAPCVMEKGKSERREMSELRLLWCICHCVQCTAELFLKVLYYSSGYIYFILFIFLKVWTAIKTFLGNFGGKDKRESNRCKLMFWPLWF